MIKLSITVPSYNEDAAILERLGRVSEQHIDGVMFEEGKKIRAHHAFAVVWAILVRRLIR